MNHRHVLQEIQARGLRISLAGADLRLEGPRERMDPVLVTAIRAVKAELMAHLAAETPAAAEGFPLTPLQRGYLLGRGEVFEMGNVASQVYHEIEGAWDIDRLESALRLVVARHGPLRTWFTAAGTQVQEKQVAGPYIERLDLRGETPAAQREKLRALRQELSQRILPADRAPLLAAQVTILAQDRMVLHFNLDGLVTDGISMFLLFREWWSYYCHGPGDGPGPEQVPFASYVAALEAARGKAPAQRSRAHWLDRLGDLAPCPDLPLRTSPSAITRPRFSRRQVRLTAAQWDLLKAHAAKAGLTPACLLLAAYAETLACWSSAPVFTINSTIANRIPIHPRIFDAIGNYTDTMLVEITVDRTLSFTDRARALQAQLRRGLDNRHFSGIEVMRELGRRRGGGPVWMPYTFNCTIGYVHGDLDGSTLELFGKQVYSVSQTPQVWLNVFATEARGALLLHLDGVDELFPEGLLDAVGHGYQTLLRALLDEHAWAAATFDLLPPGQKARRQQANDTAAPIPGGLLQDPFLAHARRSPDAPAIVTSRAVMSYGELYRRACRAAAWLRARHLRRGELVGLVMNRGPEQIVAIVATLLAGGAYLPIDATLPARRQRYMLADGRVRCVLTNVSWPPSGPSVNDGGLDILTLDASRPPPGGPPEAAAGSAPAGVTPDDLAYVLYTSGTTGEPKGVMVCHRSVINVVADCNARFAISARDRFFAISAFSFDLSVYDIFGAFAAGAALVLPDHDKATDPQHWLELCGRAGVTVWNSVPAIVSMLYDQAVADGDGGGAAGRLAALRLVMMSGDRIPPGLPAMLRRLKEDLVLVCLGGPTETTIWNILHPIDAGDDGTRDIPYGRPNANNRAYILDRDGLDAPDWVTGEICAAGVGLARGYWGDPARTAQRFVFDPRRGERLYRTGDLGCYLPDGSISILGRSDFQIKVNGYRIEAGEVETRLAALDAVKQAVVVRSEGPHGARLVAHCVPAGDARPAQAWLRQALRSQVPEYMIPAAVIWHKELPLTKNGKVDRGKLMRASAAPASPAAVPPTGYDPATAGIEQALTELWQSQLAAETVNAESPLYELGGDSITAARIIVGVRKLFGVFIPFHQLPEVDTIRAMAAHIAAVRAQEQKTAGVT